MIIHIALFKWKNGISKKQIDDLNKELKSLKGKIDGLINIFSGENFSKYSEGFEHAFVIMTKDKKSLEDYRNHPLHLEIANKIEKIEEKSIGVDFEE